MRQLKLLRWAAALTLAISLAPAAASGQEDDTLTISGTFTMDYMSGELDLYYFAPHLVVVYANGHEHTWTLTLHGTTQSHYTNGEYYATEIHATSFDLEFFGPDAATLNGIVSDHLAGGDAGISLRNHLSYYNDDDFAIMHVGVFGDNGIGMYFHTSQSIVNTLFPTDADGYPVVGPEPFSIETGNTELGYFDLLSGTGGVIGSLAGLVTFALIPISSPLPADFNNDGKVDGEDLEVWEGAFGENALADANSDGVSDGLDFLAWQQQFGSGAYAVLVGVAVPEPGSALLASIAITACGLRRVVKQVPLPARHRSRRSGLRAAAMLASYRGPPGGSELLAGCKRKTWFVETSQLTTGDQ